MYHVTPEGSPVSLKVTRYISSENDTVPETADPFTVKEPEDGFGLYILLPVAMVKA